MLEKNSKFKVFKDMIGVTFDTVEVIKDVMGYDADLTFVASNDCCQFTHIQDCSEVVYIEQIDGDLDDLIGSPLLMAEAVQASERDDDNCISNTWTFYKFATKKGHVTVRWAGSSNGFYSEGVTLITTREHPLFNNDLTESNFFLEAIKEIDFGANTPRSYILLRHKHAHSGHRDQTIRSEEELTATLTKLNLALSISKSGRHT